MKIMSIFAEIKNKLNFKKPEEMKNPTIKTESDLTIPEKEGVVHSHSDEEKRDMFEFILTFREFLRNLNGKPMTISVDEFISSYNKLNKKHIIDTFVAGMVLFGLVEKKKKKFYVWKYSGDLKISFVDHILVHISNWKRKSNETPVVINKASVVVPINKQLDIEFTDQTIKKVSNRQKWPLNGLKRIDVFTKTLHNLRGLLLLHGLKGAKIKRKNFCITNHISNNIFEVLLFEGFLIKNNDGGFILGHNIELTTKYINDLYKTKSKWKTTKVEDRKKHTTPIYDVSVYEKAVADNIKKIEEASQLENANDQTSKPTIDETNTVAFEVETTKTDDMLANNINNGGSLKTYTKSQEGFRAQLLFLWKHHENLKKLGTWDSYYSETEHELDKMDNIETQLEKNLKEREELQEKIRLIDLENEKLTEKTKQK